MDETYLLREDTIAAISTPVGRGALGVVRLSGPGSKEALVSLWAGPPLDHLKRRRSTLGRIRSPEGTLVDEVLICWMPGPASYTGEDVLEISCHGNPHILGQVMDLLRFQGVRVAAPGEFTFRAFRNGRMTLTQAEAVAELIEAKGQWARANALSVLAEEGDIWVQELMESLVQIWVPIEADMEFPTDDLDSLNPSDFLPALQDLSRRMSELASRATRFSKLQEGYRVVLAGERNAGKSSLLNALLGYSRALVTDIPGTTRDTLEEILEIQGIPIRLIDTAGLGETKDLLDAQGMERSRQAISRADVVVYVLDASEQPPPSDPMAAFADFLGCPGSPQVPLVVVGNKEDLLSEDSPWKKEDRAVRVSAKTEQGLPGLTAKIAETLVSGAGVDLEQRLMLNQRQAETLSRGQEVVDRAIANIQDNAPQDLIATDLQEAKTALEELSGRVFRVDLMETIFSRFCIGK
jgi:tRNA modification GTPase